MHKRNPTRLTQLDFENLFSDFNQSGLNWLTYKKYLSDKKKTWAVPHKKELSKEFVVYPRNHHNGGVATALICEKAVCQALSY